MGVWKEHSSWVIALTVLADGTVVSGSQDKTLRRWAPSTGQCLGVWEGHTDSVNALTVLADGTVVSGSDDCTLRRWSPRTGECLGVWEGHTDRVEALTVLPDGTVVSGSWDETLRRWAPSTGECLGVWKGHRGWVLALTVLPDGSVVSGGCDKTLRRFMVLGDIKLAKPAELGSARMSGNFAHYLTMPQYIDMLKELASNVSVKDLTLTDMPLRDEGVTLLSQVLAQHPALTKLTLERCGLTDELAAQLLNSLQQPQCSLKTLELKDNPALSTIMKQKLQRALVEKVEPKPVAVVTSPAKQSVKITSAPQEVDMGSAPQEVDMGLDLPSPLPPEQVRALYSYKARCSDELSISKGAILDVLQGDSTKNWLYVEDIEGRTGRVPRNYLVFMSEEKAESDIATKPQFSSQPNRWNTPLKTPYSPSTSRGTFSHPSQQSSGRLTNPNPTRISSDNRSRTGQPIINMMSSLSFIIEPNELQFVMKKNPRTGEEERQCLGQGGFGAVYKAKWRHEWVAVKELTLVKMTNTAEEEFINFTNEVQVMMNLRITTQIVGFYGMTLSPRYWLVMEYCENGSLYEYLHNPKETISWTVRLRLATEIAKGLAFLHASKPVILHRDLTSHNVLLDKHYHAKLCDFGLSRVKQETRFSSRDSVGTPQWMAPELFKRNALYETGSDMYSYGMVLWELSSREIPWNDTRDKSVISHLVCQGDRENIPATTPVPIAQLIKHCWLSDPKQRPSASEVLDTLENINEWDLTPPQDDSTDVPNASGVHFFEPMFNVSDMHFFEPNELQYVMVKNSRTGEEERQCLGRGSFGVVYKAKWRHQWVAVKEPYKSKMRDKYEKEFINEVQVMTNLRISQIVGFYGMSLSPRYRLVMEYCEKGSLYDYLHSPQDIRWSMRLRLATEIAQGLAFLHASQPVILHRSLTSHNVLLDEHYHAKLCDFGLSRIKELFSDEIPIECQMKQLRWMAPELFKRRAKYETGSDMYSYGMVLWELSSRAIPWSDAMNDQQIIHWISQGEREDIPPETPVPIAQLIKHCWHKDPKQRPSASEALATLKNIKKTGGLTSPEDDGAAVSNASGVHFFKPTN